MDKKQLTESDIRARYITPAIEQAGWDPMTQIFHEFGLRAGRISVRGRAAHRDQRTVLECRITAHDKEAKLLAKNGLRMPAQHLTLP